MSDRPTRTDDEWDSARVAAIVVNFRTPQLTIACVESLLASRDVTPRILVVDNDSGDDSVERLTPLEDVHPSVHLVARRINDGYTGGNNVGVSLARAMGARYAFILNSDTIVDPDCVRRLVDACERDAQVAVSVPRIFFGDEPQLLWFGGGRFSLWRGRPIHVALHQTAEHGWTTARDVAFASGCAMLIRLSVVAGDPFDPTLFAYAEDLELSLQLQQRGWRLRYIPEATVWHFEGGSHRQRGGNATRFYFTTRNVLRVVARHARWYHWLTLTPMLAIDLVARLTIVAIRDRDWLAVGAVWRGCWHALAGGLHPVERTLSQRAAHAAAHSES